jgi:hypothetical protein
VNGRDEGNGTNELLFSRIPKKVLLLRRLYFTSSLPYTICMKKLGGGKGIRPATGSMVPS